MSDYWAGECVVNERLAKHRAAVLRPILELEKRGEPISTAIGDAAWGCCHVNSPSLQFGMPVVDQAACAADFHASNASSRW